MLFLRHSVDTDLGNLVRQQDTSVQCHFFSFSLNFTLFYVAFCNIGSFLQGIAHNVP